MEIITTRQQLMDLAARLKVRDSWHEPDEQGLTARVDGFTFDNAGFWPMGQYLAGQARFGTRLDIRRVEQHVVISKSIDGCDECGGNEYEDVAAINLATLLAWACGHES